MSSVDHGNEIETAAIPADQITAEGSVGSDTDTGGPLKSDSTHKDGPHTQHHARSNSVKKPTTFKAVSVTKNFLAKASTPAAPNPKVNGDSAANTNGVTTMPPMPRPRLVAKSASGAKQAKPHFGSRNGSGPDPMQVWNRNRAAPQPTPKHLTDEELKQQYGIHLATRIQADADGKEAKWADIDDDEDDWAPETIEWNDGTKITLAQNDAAALLAEQQAAEEAAKKRQEAEKKAKAALEKKPTTTVGPNATVLKPRSAALKPGTPLVLKTPTEKPTLVSKPTTSTPAKSPWAPLPAIDKVPPIEINPPAPAPTPRSQQNGVVPPPQSMPPPQPAMEIAADSFRRGGSDAQKDNVGQLYNAGTGKYEPAAGGRRGSVRKDGNFRAPSVLQRGGSAQDTSAPAEPSPAFQTRRTSQNEHAPWDRRKSSMSVEGGARPTFGKDTGFPSDRRGSQQSQAVQSPTMTGATLSAVQSPAIQHSQLIQDGRPTAQTYHARAGSNNANVPGERDAVALQQQLMRERREQAIKRRKDQEEKEEAEKKERIRKKLEGLGPVPVKEPKKDVQTKTIEKRPTDAKTEEVVEQKEIPSTPSKEAPLPSMSPIQTQRSPPKPPAPSTSGVPQQYGMMKVHGQAPKDVLQQVNDTLHAEKAKMQPPNQVTSPPGLESKSAPAQIGPSPIVNGVSPQKPTEPLFQSSPDLLSQRSLGDSRQQPWNNGLARESKLYGWSAQQTPREPNSVWGISQSRTLGNGTFDRTIQRPSSRQQDQYSSPALAPIGPPKHLQPSRDVREERMGPSPGPTFEQPQAMPFQNSDARPARLDAQGRSVNGEQKVPSPQFPTGVQLGQRRMDVSQRPQSRESIGSQLAAWSNFQQTDAREEAEKRRQWEMKKQAKLAEEARTGIRHEPPPPVYEERWKKIDVNDQTGRSVIGVTKAQNATDLAPNMHAPMDLRAPPFMNVDMANGMPGGLGRGSRFFPTTGRPYPFQQAPLPFSPFHRRSDSPPPPDSVFHPAQATDSRRPIVRLPSDLAEDRILKPKVRLPPAVVTPVQSPQMSHAQMAMRPSSQPLVNNPSWQDRFNGLLGVRKMSSPEKSPEKRVAQVLDFSATREPLNSPTPKLQASVALPPSESDGLASLMIASQDPQDEEALFEPESGSTPAILFPSKRPGNAWPLKKGQMRPLTPSNEVSAVTKDVLQLPDSLTHQNMLLVAIRLKGMTNPRTKSMRPPPGYTPIRDPAQNQAPPRQQNGNRPKQHNKGYKPRESSGSFNNPASKPTPSTGPGKSAGSGERVKSSYQQRNPSVQQSRGQSQPQPQPQQQRQPASWENSIV